MTVLQQQRSSILVYSDNGTSPVLVKRTIQAINEVIDTQQYNVLPVLAYDILHTDWYNTTALIVMPGGRDIPYLNTLGKRGTDKIREYVYRGGQYLGLCAGGYFGSTYVEFAKDNNELQVLGARPLQFYPDNCVGPVYNHFKYNSENGAYAATIKYTFGNNDTYNTVDVYLNGGGAFINTHKYSNVDVLAYYTDISTDAAIVQCYVGNGSAILTGPHPEIDIHYIGADIDNSVKQKMTAAESHRHIFWSQLLGRLIDVKSIDVKAVD